MSRPCDGIIVQGATLLGAAGGCRDAVDLQQLDRAWANMRSDMRPVLPALALRDPGTVSRFVEDAVAFELWSRDMHNWGPYFGIPFEYTTWPAQVQAFDTWGAKIKVWRDWYQRHTGQAPTGPAPEEPGASRGAGVADAVKTAATAAVVGLAIWGIVTVVRK